ncbi:MULTISPECIES: hypothetical protein [Aliarcobacter]|uniref:hypothetical protein n=1 Tax=Aliarcobacter TaxID=2321111 RepID=UPI00112F564B|nr:MULTISPECIES: hypothetical protein [Aliarcobacter]MDX4048469.1 hypothetical protein [Aliarcobacter skirrowii]
MKVYYNSCKLNLSQNFTYELSGFSFRSHNERLGLDELLINIVWIKDNNCNNLVLISMDLLYIPEVISTMIYDYLYKNFKLEITEIFFNSSHTHSAPGVDINFDKSIDNSLINYLVDMTQSLFSNIDFIDCRIKFVSIKPQKLYWISRRKIGRNIRKFFLKKETIMLPNKENIIDDKIRLVIFEQITNNNLNNMIFNFSCHPVFNTNNELSSDFIGVIRNNINNTFNIKSTYLQGFLGDIRPNFTINRFSGLNFIDKLKLFFNKEIFKRYDKNDFNQFCENITKDICEYEKIGKNILIIESFKITNFDFELISKTGLIKKNLTTKLALFGNYLMLSISAEVNSKYYVELSKVHLDLEIFPLGLAENVIGYLPFYTECDEFGYEVNSYANYGWDSMIGKNSLKKYYNCLNKNIYELKKSKDLNGSI